MTTCTDIWPQWLLRKWWWQPVIIIPCSHIAAGHSMTLVLTLVNNKEAATASLVAKQNFSSQAKNGKFGLLRCKKNNPELPFLEASCSTIFWWVLFSTPLLFELEVSLRMIICLMASFLLLLWPSSRDAGFLSVQCCSMTSWFFSIPGGKQIHVSDVLLQELSLRGTKNKQKEKHRNK